MSFYSEFDNLSLNKLIEIFEGDPIREVGDPVTFYPDIAIRIAKVGEEGFLYLQRALSGDNPFRVFAAIIGLGRLPDSTKIEEKIVQLLDGPREIVVRGAILFLMAKHKAEYVDKIMFLLNHPSPIVVTAVLAYMAELYPDKAFQSLKDAVKHPDSRVRWRACDGFEEIGKIEAVEYLEPLLDDSDEDVRIKAEKVIKFLQTGEFPY
ncbi:MAG: hypothetical protein BBJ57_01080 [Desulfobacterales bacterium PC51MH44]|nr:MAG: hypothetical protein BBJ57_01080 [Desulfobacterales bacterium PC51MH44]